MKKDTTIEGHRAPIPARLLPNREDIVRRFCSGQSVESIAREYRARAISIRRIVQTSLTLFEQTEAFDPLVPRVFLPRKSPTTQQGETCYTLTALGLEGMGPILQPPQGNPGRDRRQSARLQAGAKHKAARLREGQIIECAVCGWRPPNGFENIVQAHHMVPVAAGGTDEDGNFICLCPNHHALCHALFPMRRRIYYGPRDRETMVRALRDPESYRHEVILGALR